MKKDTSAKEQIKKVYEMSKKLKHLEGGVLHKKSNY